MSEDHMGFEDRMLTQELSPDFVRYEIGDGLPESEVREQIQEGVKWFERNYPVVAQVTENDEYYGSEVGYRIEAITKYRADIEEAQRGMRSVLYWISNADA
jgi:hypothetical protein